MKFSVRASLFIFFCFVLALFFFNSIRALTVFAMDMDNTNASQILLIPFISATLIWLNRTNIFRNVSYSVVPGIAVEIAGLGLVAAGKVWGPHLVTGDRLALMTAGLLVFWFGGFLFFFGLSPAREGAFPLALLLFCMPIPSPILEPTIDLLRRGSTEMAFVILKLAGMPVYRQGFVFTLPDLLIEVAPECSGIRSFISLFILSLIAGHMFLNSVWRWFALLLASVPIMVFKNGLRISVLSFLAVHVDKQILTSNLHREGGIPFFAVGLLLIYPIFMMLVKSEKKSATTLQIAREADV